MLRLTLVCVALTFGAVPAAAQINPFGPYSSDRLTADDRRLAEEASGRIYKAATPSIGASQSWSNAESGNSGTVTLVNIHDYQGMPCRTLEHHLQIKDRPGPIVLRLDRCRTDTGEWKIL